MSAPMRGADLLVQSLADAGSDVIFALSGNQIMPIFDACLTAGIRIVHTRHEAAAVFMAEAYAQVTGKIGVALVTAGGGLANTAGALFSASESETPVLLLSGDSPVGQDGRGAFQEMDQTAITAPLTRLSLRPKSVDRLEADLGRALTAATADRPGPVHMALPVDILTADAQPVGASSGVAPHKMAEDTLARITSAISKADRPLIVLGPALNNTRAPGLAQALRDALEAPVVAMESPRGLNDPSLGGLREVFGDSDLIVVIGKRVDFTLGFGTGDAQWICIQPDAPELDRARRNLGDRLVLSAQADAQGMAQALIGAPVAQPKRQAWCDSALQKLSTEPAASATDAAGKITSAGLCAAVQEALSNHPDSIAICDGGEFGQWAQALLRAGRRIINGPSGAIGAGIAYGIGARAARPDARIVALMGDGTAGFHLPEFETAARENLPVVAVIGNDRRWNAEHQIQLRDYGQDRLTGCDLSGARYDLAAAGLGAHGEYVTRLEDLVPALERAFASGKPACVNVEITGLPAPAAH
ncbi:Thiamine pyrophosphate-requiring enzyme [Roseobacter sp. AzwK-3b]|uniref:thiamine pyrophosphate-binding protein n=1 Tax=Roseobacter sp. AzwK-3b TaxID=351016 RepID=UPI0001568E89|nr:thiamine pyrophosphate-binding protein [Roseobacter sp. AzwK-3b]EDM71567.1 Thiamine pyrophosphate-requiring enzyme [Roseobacter sp. AzwK-3b]